MAYSNQRRTCLEQSDTLWLHKGECGYTVRDRAGKVLHHTAFADHSKTFCMMHNISVQLVSKDSSEELIDSFIKDIGYDPFNCDF